MSHGLKPQEGKVHVHVYTVYSQRSLNNHVLDISLSGGDYGHLRPQPVFSQVCEKTG